MYRLPGRALVCTPTLGISCPGFHTSFLSAPPSTCSHPEGAPPLAGSNPDQQSFSLTQAGLLLIFTMAVGRCGPKSHSFSIKSRAQNSQAFLPNFPYLIFKTSTRSGCQNLDPWQKACFHLELHQPSLFHLITKKQKSQIQRGCICGL